MHSENLHLCLEVLLLHVVVAAQKRERGRRLSDWNGGEVGTGASLPVSPLGGPPLPSLGSVALPGPHSPMRSSSADKSAVAVQVTRTDVPTPLTQCGCLLLLTHVPLKKSTLKFSKLV